MVVTEASYEIKFALLLLDPLIRVISSHSQDDNYNNNFVVASESIGAHSGGDRRNRKRAHRYF